MAPVGFNLAEHQNTDTDYIPPAPRRPVTRESCKMIRVGLVGIGFMGMTHYLAYEKIRGARVVAVCESDPRRRAGDWRTIQGNFGPRGEIMDLAKVAQYAELDELLADADVDMVDICLPTALHPAMAVAALAAGKHVFCEKPIALTPADAKRMAQAAAAAGKILQIGHVLPFFPEYRFAYETIVGGKHGKLLGGHFKRIISEPAWMPGYFDPAKFGGPMLDLHVHDAQFIRLVCGMPRQVQTVGSVRGKVLERFSTQFVFDDPDLVVTAACGVIAQQGRPFTHGFEIYLERATLLFDFAAIAGGLNRAHAADRIERQWQGGAAEARRGRSFRGLRRRVERSGSRRAARRSLADLGRPLGLRRRLALPQGDGVGVAASGGEGVGAGGGAKKRTPITHDRLNEIIGGLSVVEAVSLSHRRQLSRVARLPFARRGLRRQGRGRQRGPSRCFRA